MYVIYVFVWRREGARGVCVCGGGGGEGSTQTKIIRLKNAGDWRQSHKCYAIGDRL